MSNNNIPKKTHAYTVGAILILLGITLYIINHSIEQEQYQAESERRWNYIQEEYPPGAYRGPEVSEYLFQPYPIPPARGVKNFGLLLAGIGTLIIFIKIIQEN